MVRLGSALNSAKFAISLHQLDLAGAPGFIEPRFQRAVEAQDHEPAFAGQGLHPVILVAFGSFRAEVNIYGAIGVFLQVLVLAADARRFLVCLDHGAGLVVRAIVGVGMTPPNVVGTPKPASSVRMSKIGV